MRRLWPRRSLHCAFLLRFVLCAFFSCPGENKRWPLDHVQDVAGVSWDARMVAVRTWRKLHVGPWAEWERLLVGGECVVRDYGQEVQRKVLEQRAFVAIAEDGSVEEELGNEETLFLMPGSFNPLHDGHVGLARACAHKVYYELSVMNVDKPPLSVEETLRRCAQFAGLAPIVLSSAPTFVEKVRLLGRQRPRLVFCVGVDTAERLPRPQYYGGTAEGAEAARRVFEEGHVKFLVAPRLGRSLDEAVTQPQWRALIAFLLSPLFFPFLSFFFFFVQVWKWNLRAFPSLLASDFLLALGLFGVAYVAWVLTKAYRSAGGLAPKIMFLFFLIGAVVPAVGFLQNLGSTTAGDNIFAAWSNPNNYYASEDILVGLQISFLMATGRSVWVQAMLYVLLGAGFLFEGVLGMMHSASDRQTRLPNAFRYHSLFSFAIAALGFAVFAADVAKFFFVDAHSVYGLLTVIYLVLCIPVWVMWLGVLLAEIPAEFLKGTVRVKGPAYAELAEARGDTVSVEMEENPRATNAQERDDNVVEINLE